MKKKIEIYAVLEILAVNLTTPTQKDGQVEKIETFIVD